MEKINVLVLADAGEGGLARIAGISPRINVNDASKMLTISDRIVARRQHTDKTAIDSDTYERLLAEAEVVYGFSLPPGIITRAPRLKWIHAMIAGVDGLLTPEIIDSPVILTSGTGIHGTPVGEIAMGMIFLLAKRAIFSLESKRLKQWNRYVPGLLCGQTTGIVGLGAIGSEIARMCKTFGMKVIGMRRSISKETKGRYVDRVLPYTGLNELLAVSDYVVNVLPLTPETEMLIGEKELRLMKKTAYFVNIGRGRTVDEPALIRALEEERIAGAALDTYFKEPLPADSKLWELPNVYISPHIAGLMHNYNELATGVFCDNLQRYVNGKKLKNIVNKKRGY